MRARKRCSVRKANPTMTFKNEWKNLREKLNIFRKLFNANSGWAEWLNSDQSTLSNSMHNLIEVSHATQIRSESKRYDFPGRMSKLKQSRLS